MVVSEKYEASQEEATWVLNDILLPDAVHNRITGNKLLCAIIDEDVYACQASYSFIQSRRSLS
jgi:hypothetical protein